MQIVTREALFPEGPLVRDGILYYAEYGGDRVSMWEEGRPHVLWSRVGSGPSAIAALGVNFAVMCFTSGEVAVISAEGRTLAVYDRDEAGGKLLGPNDATSDGQGGIYFTLSGPWEPGPIVGRVMHMSVDGRIREMADDLHFANGIVRTNDGKRLLVAESEANRIISFSIALDGSLHGRKLFARMRELGEDASAYPDGLKIGPDGNLYIGHFSSGRITVAGMDGKALAVLDVPSAAAPNLAFSEDGKTIFVTAVDDPANAPYRGTIYALTR